MKRSSVSEAKLEAARLGGALAKVRTSTESRTGRTRKTERTKAGFERALATVLADGKPSARAQARAGDGRRADVERARVADEAAAVVEGCRAEGVGAGSARPRG